MNLDFKFELLTFELINVYYYHQPSKHIEIQSSEIELSQPAIETVRSNSTPKEINHFDSNSTNTSHTARGQRQKFYVNISEKLSHLVQTIGSSFEMSSNARVGSWQISIICFS